MKEVAEELGVPLATIRRWRLNGQGPASFRAGRHVRIRRADFERWIADQLSADSHNAT